LRGRDGLTDAERRQPRPDPNRRFNERRFGYHDYPDYPWWYGRNDYYWFPYRYDYGAWQFTLRHNGYMFGPHSRLWDPDEEVWFYWPFDNEPRLGCHWYWVPTERRLDRFGPRFQRRWRYRDWRMTYMCIDGRENPWR
jgi:hypothetical protein